MKHFPALLLIGALALTSVTSHAARRALLVGIEKYPSRQVPNLHGPLEDVANMKTIATRVWGYRDRDIKLLRNGDATRANIITQFRQWLIKGTKPGDEVLFYYSGHGSQQPDDNGDETVDHADETIVPVDTVERNGRFVNMITDDVFKDLTNELSGRRVTLVFDSCHSGTMTRSLGGANKNDPAMKLLRPPKPLPLSRSLVTQSRKDSGFLPGNGEYEVWSAVAPSQIAFTDKTLGHGSLFTNRFYDGLVKRKADANGDGAVSRAELKRYLARESDRFCKRWKSICLAGLTPMLDANKDLLPVAMNRPVARPAPPSAKPKKQRVATVALLQKPRNRRETASRPQSAEQVLDAAIPGNDSDDIALKIYPGRHFLVGDRIAISVTSRRAGQLVLLDVNADGKLTQLFPNKYSQAAGIGNRIKAGQRIELPGKYGKYHFVAEPPLGSGKLIALVVTDGVDLTSITGGVKDLQVIPEPTEYITRLAEKINQRWSEDVIDRQVDWAVEKISYEIAKK